MGANTLTTDGVNNTLVGWNFSMNDMPGFSELTAMFDFYKLNGVLIRVLPYKQTDSNSVGGTNNSFNPPIFYAIDRFDSTNPATVDELLEYNDHKIASVWKGFRCYIKSPKFADATAAVRGGWVATSNPSLNWNGLKIAIPAAGSALLYFLALAWLPAFARLLSSPLFSFLFQMKATVLYLKPQALITSIASGM